MLLVVIFLDKLVICSSFAVNSGEMVFIIGFFYGREVVGIYKEEGLGEIINRKEKSGGVKRF